MTIPLRILNDTDIRSILDIRNTVACVEKAYISKAKNDARLFPLVCEDLFSGKADMDIKSGVLNSEEVFGLKLVTWFGSNEKLGLPALTGLTLLFDLKTGFPKALLNARHFTAMRTGAAGAIGIKYLARQNPEVLLIAGTGFQAVFQLAAALSEIPTLNKIYIYNPIRYESAVKFQHTAKEQLGKIINDFNDSGNAKWLERIASTEFIAVKDLAAALQETDTVITITPSTKSYLPKEYLRPGTHISCVGADMPGKQEVDENIFEEALPFTDDINQSITVGETQTAVKAGILSENQLTEIGHVIMGNHRGRQTEIDITVFDSTGIALQDLSVSKHLLSKAATMNLGTIVHL